MSGGELTLGLILAVIGMGGTLLSLWLLSLLIVLLKRLFPLGKDEAGPG